MSPSVDRPGSAVGDPEPVPECPGVDTAARDALAATLDPGAFTVDRGLTKVWEQEIRRHAALAMAERAWVAGYRLVVP